MFPLKFSLQGFNRTSHHQYNRIFMTETSTEEITTIKKPIQNNPNTFSSHTGVVFDMEYTWSLSLYIC